MIHDDPLLRTYRDAAELYLRVVDMPSELRERYLTTVCVGRDLLKFTVEELVRGDAADGSRPAGEDARCVSADRVTATLIRFTDALNTVAPAHPEVTAYVTRRIRQRPRTHTRGTGQARTEVPLGGQTAQAARGVPA